jgi:hypothetical protein
MTAIAGTLHPASLKSGKNIHPTRWLLGAGLLGIVVGILFILVQPLFGMDPLTSRHAAAYQHLGNWSPLPAMIIAWLAHLVVSVLYGLMGGVVVMAASRWPWVVLWTLVFTWVTTVIAPPANAIIVQLVSLQLVDVNKLPSLNFSFDEKFVLHLVVFVAITAPLWGYKKGTPLVGHRSI